MNVYAYIRVSSADQCEARQLAAAHALGIPDRHIFIDKISGKHFDRPEYTRMLTRLKWGDVLYVKSIDRLGRNYHEILEQWRYLLKIKGIDVVVLDMPILDTRQGKDLLGQYIADAVLSLLSFVAQKERDDIRTRQREGIVAAQKRGVVFGRPVIGTPDNFEHTVNQWMQGKILFKQACMQTGLSQSTFYRRLKAWRERSE